MVEENRERLIDRLSTEEALALDTYLKKIINMYHPKEWKSLSLQKTQTTIEDVITTTWKIVKEN